MKNRARVLEACSLCLLLQLGLLGGCGRSEKQVGGGDDESSSGAGDAGGSGGTTGGTGGTGGNDGGATIGGSGGTGGGGTGGTGGKGGASGRGGASGSGGSAGSSGAGAAGAGGGAGKADCAAILDAYEAAFTQAKHCEPTAKQNQCTLVLTHGLQCGQGEYVNPEEADALRAIGDAASAYHDGGCERPVTCGAALDPVFGRCTSAGVCETVFDSGGGACQVDGVVYPDGSTGILPSFADCDCECNGGRLVCPDSCTETCANGTARGEQCTSCGPTDACLIVETTCLEICVTSCSDTSAWCLSGLCRTGVCG